MKKIQKNKHIKGSLYTNQEIEEIFYRFSQQRPNPRSELHYKNPFTLLVAVVLSAQATDLSVNKATQSLFTIADNPKKMLSLGEAGLSQYIRTIGLWRNKAKNILGLCRILITKFNGKIPNTRDSLMSLPGVGRKTANVVLNIVFHQATLAVDTHIFRIANRIGLAPADTPTEVEEKLIRIIPEKYLPFAHHWLILHGRYVCKARQPICSACIIADLCRAAIKTNKIPAPIITLNNEGSKGV